MGPEPPARARAAARRLAGTPPHPTAGTGEPGSKKSRGNEYDCAECGISYPQQDMIKSMRHKHTRTTQPEAAQGDAVQDALGQERLKDLSREEVAKLCQKVCKECEVKLRLEEWHAA